VPDQGPAMGGEPLRLVPRGYDLTGTSAFHPPHHEKHTKKAWKMLETYLDSIDDILDELKPLVRKIVVNNAIVVMVCVRIHWFLLFFNSINNNLTSLSFSPELWPIPITS
jgi:hypothetical protein